MSLLTSLDNGIEDTGYDSDNSEENNFDINLINFKNPFFNREKVIINNKYVKLIDLTQKEFYYNFTRVFAICLKNNCTIDNKFYSEVIPILVEDLNKYMKWETVPYQKIRRLYLKYIGNWQHDSYGVFFTKYTNLLNDVSDKYNSMRLKIRPYLDYEIKMEVPVLVYINNKKYDYFKIFVSLEKYQDGYHQTEISNNSENFSIGSCLPKRKYQYNVFEKWNIELPDEYSLDNIYDIEVRLGRINKDNVEFKIFRF